MAKDESSGGEGDGAKAKQQSKWGKGKTDQVTWWKKGCASPNPKGRGKGRRNQKTLYRKAFAAKIEVKVGGKPTVLTKDEVSYIQFADRCTQGDPKAIALKMQLDARFEDPEPPRPTPEQTEQNLKGLDYYIALRAEFGPKPEMKEVGDD